MVAAPEHSFVNARHKTCVKKAFGSMRHCSDGRSTRQSYADYLPRHLQVLKYLPMEKAQDARNFVQALQYWLGGNPQNLENLLLATAQVCNHHLLPPTFNHRDKLKASFYPHPSSSPSL